MVNFQILSSLFILLFFTNSFTQCKNQFIQEFLKASRQLWACPYVDCFSCLEITDRHYCSVANSNGLCCTLDDQREFCQPQLVNCSSSFRQDNSEKYLSCNYDSEVCGTSPYSISINDTEYDRNFQQNLIVAPMNTTNLNSIQTQASFNQNKICVWALKKNQTQKSLQINIQQVNNAEIYFFKGYNTFLMNKTDSKNITSPQLINIEQFGDDEYVYMIGRSLGAEALIQFKAISFNCKIVTNNTDTNQTIWSNQTNNSNQSNNSNNTYSNTTNNSTQNTTNNSTQNSTSEQNNTKTNNSTIIIQSESKTNLILIIGFSVGSTGLFAIIVFLIYYICRVKQKKDRHKNYQLQKQEEDEKMSQRNNQLNKKTDHPVMSVQPSVLTNRMPYSKVQEEQSVMEESQQYQTDQERSQNLDNTKKRQERLIIEQFEHLNSKRPRMVGQLILPELNQSLESHRISTPVEDPRGLSTQKIAWAQKQSILPAISSVSNQGDLSDNQNDEIKDSSEREKREQIEQRHQRKKKSAVNVIDEML